MGNIIELISEYMDENNKIDQKYISLCSDSLNMTAIMIFNDVRIRYKRIKERIDKYMDLRDKYIQYNEDEKFRYSINDDTFLLVEEIVYHTRKCIDEMIYTIWINKVGVQNIDNLTPVDSIGKYLNQSHIVVNEFDEFLDFFKRINGISNSYKHSLNMDDLLGNDITNSKQKPSLLSYAIREKEKDSRVFLDELLCVLEELISDFYENLK